MPKAPETRLAFIPYGLMGSCWLLGETSCFVSTFHFRFIVHLLRDWCAQNRACKAFQWSIFELLGVSQISMNMPCRKFPKFLLVQHQTFELFSNTWKWFPLKVWRFLYCFVRVFGSPKRCPDKVPKLMLRILPWQRAGKPASNLLRWSKFTGTAPCILFPTCCSSLWRRKTNMYTQYITVCIYDLLHLLCI